MRMEVIKESYSIYITLLAIFLFIWGLYNRIKYLCLEKATKAVADVENRKDLTGKEKFALCIIWINEELPKVFKNSFFQATLEKIVQLAYDTSFDYLKNYIHRKTGMDISEAIETIKNSTETEKEVPEQIESKDAETDK